MIKKKYISMLTGATFSSMINAVLIISDSFVCAFFLGESAVTAINLVAPIYNFGIFIAMLLSLGIPVVYSNAMGRFQKEEADLTFGTGISACLAGGLLLFLSLTVFQGLYFDLYPASAELEQLAEDYYFWVRFELLVMPVAEVLVETVFADGDASCAVTVSIVEVISNIAFSILLCGVMGIAGVALGSVIAVVLRLLVSLTHLRKENNSLRPNLHFSFSVFFRSVRIATINAGNYLCLAVFSGGLNIFVGWWFGEEYLILVSILLLVQEFLLIFVGVGEAAAPIINVYLSEGCSTGVRKVWRYAAITVLVEGLGVMLLIGLLAPWIPKVLGVTDPSMAGTASLGIALLTPGMVFTCYLYLLTSYYLLMEKLKLSFLISAMRDVLLVLPMSVLCGMAFGINGLFFGIALGSLMAFAITMLYGYGKHGRKNFPLLLAEMEKERKCCLFELKVAPEEIIRLRDAVEKTLLDQGVEKQVVMKCMLAIEETLMLVYEKNKAGRVSGECELQITEDKISVILRDNGMSLDLTDPEMGISSFRGYVAPGLLSRWCRNGKHLITMSFNRNLFEMPI